MKHLILAMLAMGMPLIMTSAPATEPLNPESMYLQSVIQPVQGEAVSLDLAKKHLNIEADYHDDDELIQGYIASAVDFVEGYTGRPLIGVSTFFLSSFTGSHLDVIPVVASHSVQYFDSVEYVDLPSDDYDIVGITANCYEIIFSEDSPVIPASDKAIKVTVNTTCPAVLKHAVLLKVGEAYAFRENRPVNGVDNSVYSLCRNYRINWS
jgi:hypothetical protein